MLTRDTSPRLRRLLPALLLSLVAVGCATTVAISDRDFGLSKHSVFEDVLSKPFSFEDEVAPIAPAPGSGVPPMISHAIDEYLPLTLAKNECRECHDKPARIGQPVVKNRAQPAPVSHYQNTAGGMKLAGAKFNCTSCHAPQADVGPLVGNTSK